MKASWTCSAAFRSLEAATTTVGTPLPTSSAWEGPDRATTGQWSRTSWPITSVRVREVSFSTPLDTETMTVPGLTMALSRAAVVRTAKDGVASTTSALSAAADMSEVSFSAPGRGTPLSTGFSRVSRRVLDSSST